MKSIHLSTSASLFNRRIVSTALMLALGITAGPLLAGQGAAAEAPAHSTVKCLALHASRGDDKGDVSSSRINGRADWDVDYPSQLAPPDSRPSCASGAVVTGAPAANTTSD